MSNLSKEERIDITNRARKRGKYFEKQVAALIVKAFRDSGLPEFKNIKDNAVRRRKVWEIDEVEKGDILILDPKIREVFPFCVECKDVASFPRLEKLMMKPGKQFQDYWEQAVGQAELIQKIPMLVWKQGKNASRIFCAMPVFKDYTAILIKEGKLDLAKIITRKNFYSDINLEAIQVFDFSAFIKVFISEDYIYDFFFESEEKELCECFIDDLLRRFRDDLSHIILRIK